MARSAKSDLEVVVKGNTGSLDRALVDVRDRFRAIRKEAQGAVPFPDVRLLEQSVKAGLRPMQDLKRALAETIGQAKLANRAEFSPLNEERIASAILKLKELRKAEEAASKSTFEFSKQLNLPNLKTLEVQVKAGIKSVDDLKRALAETIGQSKLANRAQFDPINDERIARAIIRLKELRAAEIQVGQESVTLAQRLGSIGGALQQAILPLAAVSAGLVLSLQNFANASHDFQTQLRLISTISKQSGKDLDDLGKEILEASVQLQASPVDLAAAQYEILSSGITNASDAFVTMTAAAKLAKAGVGTVEESADLLTSSLNALGGDPARNAEILFRAVDLGKVKIRELGESFGGVAAQAETAGVSLEEISASVATLSLSGRSASEGLTGIQAILTAVTKRSDEAKKEAKRLGIEFTTAAVRAKGLSGFLAEVAEKTQGSDESLSRLFGRVEGLNTALSLGTVNAKRYAEILNEVETSTGALDEAFQRTLNPVDRFTASVNAASIAAGKTLTNALSAPLNALSDLLDFLRKNEDLLAFGTGFGIAAGSVTTFATSIGLLTQVMKPLLPVIKEISVGLGLGKVGLAGSLGLVTIGILAFSAAAGGFVLWINRMRNATDIANKSVADFDKELKSSTDKVLQEGKLALSTAKNLDELAKRSNLTKEQKQRLKDQIDKLIEIFPDYRKEIESAARGFGTLEEAIKRAIKAQLIFSQQKAIDEELEKIKKAQKDIVQGQNVINAGGLARGVAAPGLPSKTFLKDQEKLQKRQEQLLKERANLEKRAQSYLDDLFKKEEGTPTPNPAGIPDDEEQNKIKNALEQLAQEKNKIEENVTKFQKGEIAARRLAALNNYNDEVKRIKELAKTAGKTNSPQVLRTLANAKIEYDEILKEIDRDEKRAVGDARRAIADITAEVAKLNAESTIANPFDDITAKALAATTEINKAYAINVRTLQEQLRRNPTQAVDIQKEKDALDQQYAARKAAIERTAQLEREVEFDRINDMRAANIQSAFEIKGIELEAEKANNERILADLQTRLRKERDLVQKALSDYEANPQDEDKRLGLLDVSERLNTTILEIERQEVESAKRIAAQRVASQKIVIDTIQQEIDLLGMRPELVKKMNDAYEVYIGLLRQQRDLTGQTADFQEQINQTIRQTQSESVQLRNATDSVGQLIDKLRNANLGNSDAANLFKGALDGIKQLREQYGLFKEDLKNKGLKASIADFAKSPDVKAQFGQIGNQLIQSIGAALNGGKASKLGGQLGTIFESALGAAKNPYLAAIAAPLMGLQAASQESGGFLKKYAAFIDPLGFRKIFGGGGKSAAQKAQENLEKTQKFTQQLLKNLDTNDLNSLIKSLDKVNRFKSGGGAAFQVKKDAAEQIKAAIKERKEVIAEAIKDLTFQNAAMVKAFQKLPSTPFENLKIDRDIQLDELVKNRDKALEEYKDSLELQQLIEKNFLLSREALYKQSALDIIDAVIEEQNNLRSLQAQTLVSEAEASGNQSQIINANLQAQLVALDNEIAAFKGAEEEKTIFLKAKAAERTAIVKKAQDEINELFREGRDIINEGLVVGETKAQSQKRRLQDLFGLNPLGLLQSNGQLLQTNVTVASGGFQFILKPIADARDIINQLQSDPTIQAQLIALLNAAAARA